VVDFLVGEHDFSARGGKPLARLQGILEQKRNAGAQLRLDKWF